MRVIILVLSLLCGILISSGQAHAHEAVIHTDVSKAKYIANEGVLIERGDVKIIFDPLPLSGFSVYPEPSEKEVEAIISGKGAYEGVDVVFISHAHRDHFSATRMIEMMKTQPELRLVAPSQALDMMKKSPKWIMDLRLRIIALDMEAGDDPQTIELPNVTATAFRIPHSGWPDPARATVQNMLYRVQIGAGDDNQKATVMHMGDADMRRQHFKPYANTFDGVETDTAFPPYWFFLSSEGATILKQDINAKTSIGIHVPIDVPQDLKDTGEDYFSVAGESRIIAD